MGIPQRGAGGTYPGGRRLPRFDLRGGPRRGTAFRGKGLEPVTLAEGGLMVLAEARTESPEILSVGRFSTAYDSTRCFSAECNA